MPERKDGLVILNDREKNTVFILEEGPEKNIYQFSPDKHHPPYQRGDVITFMLNDDGEIFSILFTESCDLAVLVKKTMCQNCANTIFALSPKECACGNTTRHGWVHCEVCAVRKRECVSCKRFI